MVRMRMAAFAGNHGLPEERFYNLLCLAFGADPVLFADANDYLPPTRSASCEFEYRTLANAFHKEISPHIDQEMARRVLDTRWLPDPKSKPVPQSLSGNISLDCIVFGASVGLRRGARRRARCG